MSEKLHAYTLIHITPLQAAAAHQEVLDTIPEDYRTVYIQALSSQIVAASMGGTNTSELA